MQVVVDKLIKILLNDKLSSYSTFTVSVFQQSVIFEYFAATMSSAFSMSMPTSRDEITVWNSLGTVRSVRNQSLD